MSQSRTSSPSSTIAVEASGRAGDDQRPGRQRVLVGHRRLRPWPAATTPTPGTVTRNGSAIRRQAASVAASGAARSFGRAAEEHRCLGAQRRELGRGRQRALEQGRRDPDHLRRRERPRSTSPSASIARPWQSSEPIAVDPRPVDGRKLRNRPVVGVERLDEEVAGSAGALGDGRPSPARGDGAGRPGARGRRRRRSSHGPGPGADPIACCMIPTSSVRASRCCRLTGWSGAQLRH